MNISLKILTLSALTFLSIGVCSKAAVGAAFVQAIETGGNVVFSGGGSLNLNDLSLTSSTILAFSGVDASLAVFRIGGNLVDGYTGSITGPSNFGPGTGSGFTLSSTSIGSTGFGIGAGVLIPGITVVTGYTSQGSFNGSMTFNNETFNSLGLTRGTYTWTWGSGDNFDSYTLQIGESIPEPSMVYGLGSLVLLGIALKFKKS